MKIVLLTGLTMIAFAANSVLNRMGIAIAGVDPVVFGTLRLGAGAMTLGVLAMMLRGAVPLWSRGRVVGVLSLLVYIYGFSLAYVGLDSGVGALVLFGAVQVTMFAGAIIARDTIPTARYLGAAMAFGGLVWLLWPGQGANVPLMQAGLMVLAGLGWGIYSLAGRGAGDPLQTTAANFILAAWLGAGVFLLLWGWPTGLSGFGVGLAVLSGGVTSGLGYALWYAILPTSGASRAAVAQLCVPLIAMAGGILLLGEAATLRFVVATGLVLGGVLISIYVGKKTQD